MSPFLLPVNIGLSANVSGVQSASPSIWRYGLVLNLITVVVGGFLNTAVLATFFLNPNLIHSSPFVIYCVNLVTANVFHCFLLKGLTMVLQIYPSAHWIACYLYFYLLYTADSAIAHSHLVLSINRLWAVKFPVSYRRSHNSRLAMTFCVTVWLYIHIFTVSRAVLMKYPYTLASYSNCLRFESNQQYELLTVMRSLLVPVPHFATLLLFPLIAILLVQRRRKRAVVFIWYELATGTEVKSDLVQRTIVRPSEGRVKRRTGFAVLCAMTGSLFAFWTPMTVGYVLSTFQRTSPPGLAQIAGAVRSLETIVDPLLLIATLPDLKRALISYFRKPT